MEDFDKDLEAIRNIPAIGTMLDVIRRVTRMGFVAVARVTPERWIACAVKDDLGFGLEPGGELPIGTTICREVLTAKAPIFIDSVSDDPAYRDHPTPEMYGFQSYVSMPIVLPGGQFFGTLCAIDPQPANVNRAEVVGMFELFAQLIGLHLDMAHRIDDTKSELANEKELAEAHERFVAVLGHDLKNPVAAIKSGIALLSREPLEERPKQVLGHLRNSANRMQELIDNLLDLARGRLAGGVPIRRASVKLEVELAKVIQEVLASHPDRTIDVELDVPEELWVDPIRIAQMVTNLVHNAIVHGAAETPVRVRATVENDQLTIRVANTGPAIPPAKLKTIFQPFNALETRGPKDRLGLGLYIASEIARAHGGALTVSSSKDGETCFTFAAPLVGTEI